MSKKEHYYKQCVYETPTEQGVKRDTAWIPENLAKVGKLIYFGEKRDNPEELWTVVSVGNRMRESVLKKKEKTNRKYRESTDI